MDFGKPDFSVQEKAELKILIQTLIINNNVIPFDDLDCGGSTYTNVNGEKIGIQCKYNANTMRTNKFLYKADLVQVPISKSSPKISTKNQDLPATNGVMHIVNNLLLY